MTSQLGLFNFIRKILSFVQWQTYFYRR